MGFFLLMLSLAGGGIGIAAAAGGSSSDDPDIVPLPRTPSAPPDTVGAITAPVTVADDDDNDEPGASSDSATPVETPDTPAKPSASERPVNTTPDPIVVAAPVGTAPGDNDEKPETPTQGTPTESNDTSSVGASAEEKDEDDTPDQTTGDTVEKPADNSDDATDIASDETTGPCPVTGEDVCHCEDHDEKEHETSGVCPVTGEDVCHCEDHDDSHAGHFLNEPMIPVPPAGADQATIELYVQALKDSPEDGSFHADHAGMHAEHGAVLDLVPRGEATHIAIGSGDWNDPDNWLNGEIPGDDAKALIPEGIKLTYSGDSDAELFTLRVDGALDFATDTNSTLIVDTFVVAPSGSLTIGTEEEPIQDDVDVNIVFANNGPINTDWDPTLISRGLISHGKVEIHGHEKDSHEKVSEDPLAGDTSIQFETVPEGWQVGDTIVIAGTRYEGYYQEQARFGYEPPQDEERVITQIDEDGRIHFEKPLEYDHDTPRDDLKTSVANYSRNVTFETQDADTAEVFERGHVMFMHNNDVEVRFAAFDELGRTDKSQDAFALDDVSEVNSDTNLQGRYSLHLHRTGTADQDNPAIVEGNAVYGSPGWGFVHHDSHAILENNASYDTFGAGYVAESGNETGAWNDNIAIFAQGVSWADPKGANAGVDRIDLFDFGRSGDGFWFQGRQVESSDNIAASVHNGFVYFHRGENGDTGNIPVDSNTSELAGAFHYNESIRPDEHPITGFNGNETFASQTGLYVLKASFAQNHDVYTVLEDFTAWSVRDGADLSYTGHYILQDFDITARDSSDLRTDHGFGINFGTNTLDITIVDSTFEGFTTGIDLEKNFTVDRLSDEDHDFTIINTVFTNVDEDLRNYDPTLDSILQYEDLPNLAPDIELDGPLTYNHDHPTLTPGGRVVEIAGVKSDTLGTVDFPTEAERYSLSADDVRNVLQEKGYYTTSNGQDYFVLDIYFSDRVTGDIYVEQHPVFVNDNAHLGSDTGFFRNDIDFNGVLDLGGENDPTSDVAELFATVTDGQIVLADELEDDEASLQEPESEDLL
ncbi:MAG: G8 domain-containing protein [Pseudomonadota bacterium]